MKYIPASFFFFSIRGYVIVALWLKNGHFKSEHDVNPCKSMLKCGHTIILLVGRQKMSQSCKCTILKRKHSFLREDVKNRYCAFFSPFYHRFLMLHPYIVENKEFMCILTNFLHHIGCFGIEKYYFLFSPVPIIVFHTIKPFCTQKKSV